MIQQGFQKIYSRGGAEARRLGSLGDPRRLREANFISCRYSKSLELKSLRASAPPREQILSLGKASAAL
jgi:hypothetical protein